MNRTTFSIIGGLIILILLAVWAYILFFKNGEGAAEEQPAAFTTFTPTTNNNFAPEPESTEQPLVDVTGEKEPLRQLTTRPIVGYQEVLTSSETAPLVYFIESGTGHIYSIDLGSGVEERISQTTIPEARAGVITPNGFHTLVQSGSGLGSSYVVGSLSSTTKQLSTTILDGQIDNLAVSTDNTFFFTTPVGNGLEAKEYDPVTQTSSTLFQIPFREAVVEWGRTSLAAHYVYPKANEELEGFLYQATNRSLARLPISGYGLTVKTLGSWTLYNSKTTAGMETTLHNRNGGESSKVVGLFPDKCTSIIGAYSGFICGHDNTTNSEGIVSWYQGKRSQNDNIVYIDATKGNVFELLSTESVTGRNLDMSKLQYYPSTKYVYFINKNDNTLWLFDRTLTN